MHFKTVTHIFSTLQAVELTNSLQDVFLPRLAGLIAVIKTIVVKLDVALLQPAELLQNTKTTVGDVLRAVTSFVAEDDGDVKVERNNILCHLGETEGGDHLTA